MEKYKENGKSIFIVGNGFDRAHHLKTGYSDFKKYMSDTICDNECLNKSKKNLKINRIPNPTIPDIYIKNHFIADYEQQRIIAYWLIDNASKRKLDMQWNKFENYLGKLNVERVIKKWGKNDCFNLMCLKDTVINIRGFFFEWINTIDLKDVNKVELYNSLINPEEDIALSFNYTETLELIYKMKSSNVCHIHGKREIDPLLQKEKSMCPIGENNCSLIVGFASKYLKNRNWIKRNMILMPLYKDTTMPIYLNKNFFDKISNGDFTRIYSLGFSFSDADMPYIKEICNVLKNGNCDKRMTWYISPYGNRYKRLIEKIYFKRHIRKSGFRGEICVIN